MKKSFLYRSLTVTTLLLSFVFCYGNNSENGKAYGKQICREDYDLKGPVYSAIIKEYQFKEVFGEYKRVGSKDTCVYFLSNGNIYKEAYSYYRRKYRKYEYDTNGYLNNELFIHPQAGKRYSIGSETFNDNDTIEFIKYQNTYSEKGGISEIKTFRVKTNESKQIERTVFSYFKGGKKITCYDEFGIKWENVFTNNKKSMRLKTSNRYYEWTNVVDILNVKEQITKRTITLERLDGTKFSETSQVFTYDEQGNETKRVDVSNPQKKDPSKDITSKYMYDNQGNWIRKMQYKGSKLISWEERDIYYATTDSDYNKIVEEDLKKEKERLAKLNYFRHVEDSILAEKRAVEKAIEEEEKAKGPIVINVDQQPMFPGGPSRLFDWLDENMRYHEEAREQGAQGRAFVSFVVEEDGSTSNVKITKGISNALDKEAIRLVKSMPKWYPGTVDGHAVRCNSGVTITFRLR